MKMLSMYLSNVVGISDDIPIAIFLKYSYEYNNQDECTSPNKNAYYNSSCQKFGCNIFNDTTSVLCFFK